MSLGVPNAIIQQLEPPNTEQSQIAFSPDGKKLAWRHCVPARRTGEVKLLFLQGSTWQLTGVGPNYSYNPESLQHCGDEPCFSPDSNWIGIREGLSLAIYDVLAGTAVVFSTPKSPVGNPTHPNWSPDGSEIAVGINTGRFVDLFVASGKGYGSFSRLTRSRRSDEPYYHYFKMPPPQALRLSPDQQFPGATIEILGRGFDILHPQNNKVFFSDTQRRPELREAEVLSATVNPQEGLGVLTVRVPTLAGHGPITVETRFGSSTTPEFHVLPKPSRIVQPRSVPGAKVRVFGLGFDIHTATQHIVSFTAAAGGFVPGQTLGGGLDGTEEFLIVQVPAGIAETGSIRVDNAFGGSVCTCTFTQLHPKFTITRTTGLPQYALQGSPGVPVSLAGTDFPFDPFFGYGGTNPLSIANVDVLALVAPPFPSVRIGTFVFSAASPDTARFGPTTFPFPGLGPAHPGGNLSIRAFDANLPAASAVALFQIPLTNIPIIFVPGTSGSSLDIAAGTLLPDLFASAPDIHTFPWLSKTSLPGTPYGALIHPIPVVFPLNPGLIDLQHGPRVWAGPEGVATLLNLALVPPPAGNIGNHYLDAVAFNSSGTPIRPEIVPGTVFSEVTIVPPDPITGLGGISIDVYKPLIDFLTQPNMALGWPGRPLCNGINPTTPTTGTEACFDVSNGSNGPVMSGSNAVYLFNLDWRDSNRTQAARLNTFVDTILGRADVMAAGITKVVVIAHSYGGPVARSYYLNPANGAQSKVDQVISFGGGFSGVLVPLHVLESGDTWGKGFGFGPLSVGIAEWETKALAQNWPTAYFQLPNSQSWFSDHGMTQPNGLGPPPIIPVPVNRAYVRDFRRPIGSPHRLCS